MKTIVPASTKRAAMERPDYPEFERMMKAAYGTDWELLSYDEAAKEYSQPQNARERHEKPRKLCGI